MQQYITDGLSILNFNESKGYSVGDSIDFMEIEKVEPLGNNEYVLFMQYETEQWQYVIVSGHRVLTSVASFDNLDEAHSDFLCDNVLSA